jgi:hypothetical protein
LTLGRPCVCDARTGYPRRPLSMRRACRPQPISRTRWPPSQLLDGRGIEGSAALSPASIRPRCHHREHDGYCASRHPQREALEFALDGIALDCCGHARSQEGLSQAKSLQATSGPTSRACCSLRKGNKQPRCCSKREGRLTSFTAALASQSSTERGAIPQPKAQTLFWVSAIAISPDRASCPDASAVYPRPSQAMQQRVIPRVTLRALPLKLVGAEASPVRAVLLA